MSFARLGLCTQNRRTVKWALVAWFVVLAFISVRVIVQPRTRSLYHTFATAGGDWLAGLTLYRQDLGDLDQFRYSPLTGAFLVPLHLVPERLGNVLWRCLNAGVFLGALGWWLRTASPMVLTSRQKAIVFLLVLPFSLTSLNNGQTNPLLIGLLVAAFAAAAEDRWSLAALCVALATAFKVYPLAVGLLLTVAYPRRFGPRLLVALLLTAGLPFLLRDPEYVAGQYKQWLERVGRDNRLYASLDIAYRDLWLLFRLSGFSISVFAYRLLQLGLAAGGAGLCLLAQRRGWSRQQVLVAALMLGCCWLVLCGPATEACTYVMLAPAMAWAAFTAGLPQRSNVDRTLAWGAYAILFLAVLVGARGRSAGSPICGLQPLAALLLFISYLVTIGRRSPTTAELAQSRVLPVTPSE